MNSRLDSVRTRDGLTLELRYWPANTTVATNGVILLVHGLGEHIGRYDRLARKLGEWGWSVVGYDQRGHGRSSGKHGVIQEKDALLYDLASVLDSIQPVVANQKQVLIGHSLGGLVVARFAAALSDPEDRSPWKRQVDLCVLSSPALALHPSLLQTILARTLGNLMPDFTLRNGLNPDWLCTDADVVNAYRRDPLVHNRVSGRLGCFILDAAEVVRLHAASWVIPTLLLYSGSDRCVSPSGSIRFSQAAPKSVVESRAYQSLKHEIFNEPESAGVYSALDHWLRKFSLDSTKATKTQSPIA